MSVTEDGIQDVSFDVELAKCPKCGKQCKKHSRRVKILIGLRGKRYRVVSSVHYCKKHGFFTNVGPEFAGRVYTEEVRRTAVELWYSMEKTTEDEVLSALDAAYQVSVPKTTFREWF